METKFTTLTGDLEVFDPPDPFARVPEIAARLGVQPIPEGKHRDGIMLHTKDGGTFDFIELITAFLDRMDEVHVGFGQQK